MAEPSRSPGPALPPPERADVARLRDLALSYPEAWEDFPWGERAFKVRKKVFCFLWVGEDKVNVTFKLPESAPLALSEPYASPTGYGLGKSGWVTFSYPAAVPLPHAALADWLDESYCAVAPKALVARLTAEAGAEAGGPDGGAAP